MRPMQQEGRAISGHVVVASDKFKGSLTASEVAARVAAGLGDRVRTVRLPVADGGDGTVDAVVACGFTRVEVEVSGPTGEQVKAAYGWRPDGGPDGPGPVAVIELAEASGLRRLSAGKAPLTATSLGTGQLIAHALRRGARRIVLGLGGSACTDGGAGMIQALGARLLDDQGLDLPPGGAALRRLARIDLSGLLVSPPSAPTASSAPAAPHTSAASPASAVPSASAAPSPPTRAGSPISAAPPASAVRSASAAPSPPTPAGPPTPAEPSVLAAPPAPAPPPASAASVDPAARQAAGDVEFVVASDVDNPLLGPHGAAAVYGPQKGASHSDVAILEAGLSRFARVAAHVVGEPSAADAARDESGTGRTPSPRPGPHPGPHPGPQAGSGPGQTPEPSASEASRAPLAGPAPEASPVPYADRPGAGAAGGVGFAAMAFLGARVRPGITYLLDLLRFDEHLEGARLVVTGEGSLDTQSLRGKAPVGVAEAANRRGIPVIAVCGRRALTDDQLHAAGIRSAHALTDLEPDPAICMANAGPLLERLAAQMAATEPELRG